MLTDLGHDIPESATTAFGLLAGVQSFGDLAASGVADVLWTVVSASWAFAYLAVWMALALRPPHRVLPCVWQTAGVSRRSGTAGASRFDGQAARFDQRAGVPDDAAVDIAAAVLGGHRPAAGDVVLELGPGTGEVGRHLAGLAGRYVGLDLSVPMLGVFGTKAAGPGVPLLVQADADRHWPVRDGSVTVVFASRVAHLLVADHVVAEARRVCRAGGRFVVGRIARTGLKQELRRHREALLAELGVAKGGSGRRRTEALLEAFVAAGADREPARTVATWTVTTSVDQVIAGWETMPTMGGETIAAATRTAVLTDLRHWAGEHLGDPRAPQDTTESYILEAVRLL